jgi:hypothetical protein
MTTTNSQDLIDILVTDHREVETMFAELETGSTASGSPTWSSPS